MNNETEQPVSEVDGEQVEVETSDVREEVVEEVQEERKVPLSALEAERRRRQEAEAEKRVYEQLASRREQQPQEEVDGDEWITRDQHTKTIQQAKREILEEAFVNSNPDAYQQIKDKLPGLIETKPWVEDVIKNAPNRWQRAWELIGDLSPGEATKPVKRNQDAERIVQNSKKPGSPTAAVKSATMSSVDYMRSIRGTVEWDKYRNSLVK